MKNSFFILIFLCFSLAIQAQKEKQPNHKQDSLKLKKEGVVLKNETNTTNVINPLTPARAAFYSAILPGLGQAYNKKYWKIPIVYAALGAGTYFYIDNNKEYKRYRDAYKRRLAGYEDDEFYGSVTDDGLREAQKHFRRNKELSLLITFGLYALNIIDANVDAHLLQFNVDDNLSLKPHYNRNAISKTGDLGLTLNFNF